MSNEHQGNLWIRWWHLWYSKEKVEICWFFWFKYKCRITQHIIQTLLLVGSGLGMYTTAKWKAISVSGTIQKIFYSTLIIVQSKQKIISNKLFLIKTAHFSTGNMPKNEKPKKKHHWLGVQRCSMQMVCASTALTSGTTSFVFSTDRSDVILKTIWCPFSHKMVLMVPRAPTLCIMYCKTKPWAKNQNKNSYRAEFGTTEVLFWLACFSNCLKIKFFKIYFVSCDKCITTATVCVWQYRKIRTPS